MPSFNNWTAVAQAPNTNTGDWFYTLLLYGLYVVALLLMSAYSFEVAVLTASFLFLIFGLFLVYAGLVSIGWVIPILAILIFMFLYIAWTGRKL